MSVQWQCILHVEIDVDDDKKREDARPERRGLRFVALAEDDRARIARYVEERLEIA